MGNHIGHIGIIRAHPWLGKKIYGSFGEILLMPPPLASQSFWGQQALCQPAPANPTREPNARTQRAAQSRQPKARTQRASPKPPAQFSQPQLPSGQVPLPLHLLTLHLLPLHLLEVKHKILDVFKVSLPHLLCKAKTSAHLKPKKYPTRRVSMGDIF